MGDLPVRVVLAADGDRLKLVIAITGDFKVEQQQHEEPSPMVVDGANMAPGAEPGPSTAPPGPKGPIRVGLLYDHVMTMHKWMDHPECPARVSLLHETLEARGLAARCTPLPSRQATTLELERAHDPDYVQRVDCIYSPGKTLVQGTGDVAEMEGDALIVGTDNYCNEHTSLAARTAAGCAVEAVTAVLDGRVHCAFAAVRPPGHHASRGGYSGFCFFNNTAVAAREALERGLTRILIFDWDIHHGDGTQSIFYNNPHVLTVSLHRRDGSFYPSSSGFPTEVGEGPGLGFNVNVGWRSKGMGDADYLAAYDLLLQPILESFDPELVIIGSGFDAVEGDHLGLCHMTPEGFGQLTSRLLRLAGGRVVAVLEGGYHVGQVAESSCEVVRVLLGDDPEKPEGPYSATLHKTLAAALAATEAEVAPFWPVLATLPPLKNRLADLRMSLELSRLVIGPVNAPSTRSKSQSGSGGAPSGSGSAGASGSGTHGNGGPAALPLAAAAAAAGLGRGRGRGRAAAAGEGARGKGKGRAANKGTVAAAAAVADEGAAVATPAATAAALATPVAPPPAVVAPAVAPATPAPVAPAAALPAEGTPLTAPSPVPPAPPAASPAPALAASPAGLGDVEMRETTPPPTVPVFPSPSVVAAATASTTPVSAPPAIGGPAAAAIARAQARAARTPQTEPPAAAPAPRTRKAGTAAAAAAAAARAEAEAAAAAAAAAAEAAAEAESAAATAVAAAAAGASGDAAQVAGLEDALASLASMSLGGGAAAAVQPPTAMAESPAAPAAPAAAELAFSAPQPAATVAAGSPAPVPPVAPAPAPAGSVLAVPGVEALAAGAAAAAPVPSAAGPVPATAAPGSADATGRDEDAAAKAAGTGGCVSQ